MNLFTLALSVHVVTAILGLGQVMGTIVLASSLEPGAPVGPAVLRALRRLARGTSWALALMLLSGVLLEYASGGSFHDTWWFRVSFFLLLALGGLQGRSRSVLNRLDAANDRRHLRGVVGIAFTMCGIVAVVAILMEIKPW
jgi:hypothetical protein